MNKHIRADTVWLRCAVSRNCVTEARFTGKRAVKREAIFPAADWAQHPFGSSEIKDVKLFVAVSLGNSLNRVASSQGSTPDLASAESAVRTMPFSSSPIGAYRKSLNAEVRSENAEGGVAVGPRIVTCMRDRPTRSSVFTKPLWNTSRFHINFLWPLILINLQSYRPVHSDHVQMLGRRRALPHED